MGCPGARREAFAGHQLQLMANTWARAVTESTELTAWLIGLNMPRESRQTPLLLSSHITLKGRVYFLLHTRNVSEGDDSPLQQLEPPHGNLTRCRAAGEMISAEMIIFSVLSKLRLKCHENLCPSEPLSWTRCQRAEESPSHCSSVRALTPAGGRCGTHRDAPLVL